MKRVMMAAAALLLFPALAGTAWAGGKPKWNAPVCGTSYVPVDRGHGNYFNVYNEASGRSCVSAQRHNLSWYVASQWGKSRWEYPHISSGIEWGRYTCYDGRSAYPSSPGSRCMRYPVRESRDGTPLTSVTYWPHLINGDVSYDIWFNRSRVSPHFLGQNNGTEIMIWLSHPGVRINPASVCWHAVVQKRAYTVMCWRAHGHRKTWNFVAYIADRQTRRLPPTWLNGFFRNTIAYGKLSPRWWLTGIDFGSEINRARGRFAVKSYSLTGVR